MDGQDARRVARKGEQGYEHQAGKPSQDHRDKVAGVDSDVRCTGVKNAEYFVLNSHLRYNTIHPLDSSNMNAALQNRKASVRNDYPRMKRGVDVCGLVTAIISACR